MKVMPQAMALLIYFISSVVIILLNKLIVNEFHFSMHYFLIIIQSSTIVCISLVYCAISRNFMSFKRIHKWGLLSILLTIMIFTNVKAVYYFPVTLFTLLKNLSIIIMALLEYHYFNRRISLIGFLGFVLIILSSYSANSIERVPLVGYFWMAANIISSIGYVIYLRILMALHTASRIESVFFTNLLGMPVLGLMSVLFDKPNFQWDNHVLWLLIISSSFAAFLTAFGTAWALKTTSSTTLCITGTLNKLLLSACGFMILHEQYSSMKLIALMIGLFGGMLYSYDSIKIIPPMREAVDNIAS